MKSVFGFSLIELLITVSLVTVISVIGIASLSRSKQQEDLLSVVINIVQLIERAREQTITGTNDTSWQINLSDSQASLTDQTGTPTETYILPENINLNNNGFNSIHFLRPSGMANECLNYCELELNSGNSSYQFRVLYSGTVEY